MEEVKTTVNEKKESLSYSKLNAWRRVRKMRNQYGGAAGLSAASGLGVVQIRKYCSEKYMKEHNLRQSTWEKYFGPWDDKEPTFMLKQNQNSEKEETSEMKDNTPDMDITERETIETKPEVKMPRLILEVPSLEDLDATLELYGMKLVIE